MRLRFLSMALVFCMIASSMLAGCAPADADTATDDARFLPAPDRITGYYAGQSITLSNAQRDDVYDSFAKLLPHLSKCEPQADGYMVLPWYKNGNWCIELCYDEAITFLGSLGEISNPVGDRPFDSFFMVVFKDGILAVPCSGGLIFRDAYGKVWLEFGNESAAFYNLVQGVITDSMPNPFGIEREAVNTEIVQTECFLPKPQEIVVKSNGISVKLSDVQRDQIYAAYISMDERQEGYPRLGEVIKTEYTPASAYQELDFCTCIEFRYEQRQQYTGPILEIVPEASGEETKYISGTFVFDSVVLIIHENGIKLLQCTNGLYEGFTNYTTAYDFGPGYADFRAEVLSLVE